MIPRITFNQALLKINGISKRRGWDGHVSANSLNGKCKFREDVICININRHTKFDKYYDLLPDDYKQKDVERVDRLILDRIVENCPALKGRDVAIFNNQMDVFTFEEVTDKRFDLIKNRKFYVTQF